MLNLFILGVEGIQHLFFGNLHKRSRNEFGMTVLLLKT